MTYELLKYGVVPDVVDRAPATLLNVVYFNNLVVKIGEVLSPIEVTNPPMVKWTAEPNAYYTLCMTDPDAPSRKYPKFREWHHWLVGNIPENDIGKGEVLSEYIGPFPPEDTGLHRYVFLLYKQPKKLIFDEKRLTNKSEEHRSTFSIRKFASKYNLGDPIAANMFQAEYDDYV